MGDEGGDECCNGKEGEQLIQSLQGQIYNSWHYLPYTQRKAHIDTIYLRRKWVKATQIKALDRVPGLEKASF